MQLINSGKCFQLGNDFGQINIYVYIYIFIFLLFLNFGLFLNQHKVKLKKLRIVFSNSVYKKLIIKQSYKAFTTFSI